MALFAYSHTVLLKSQVHETLCELLLSTQVAAKMFLNINLHGKPNTAFGGSIFPNVHSKHACPPNMTLLQNLMQ